MLSKLTGNKNKRRSVNPGGLAFVYLKSLQCYTKRASLGASHRRLPATSYGDNSRTLEASGCPLGISVAGMKTLKYRGHFNPH